MILVAELRKGPRVAAMVGILWTGCTPLAFVEGGAGDTHSLAFLKATEHEFCWALGLVSEGQDPNSKFTLTIRMAVTARSFFPEEPNVRALERL